MAEMKWRMRSTGKVEPVIKALIHDAVAEALFNPESRTAVTALMVELDRAPPQDVLQIGRSIRTEFDPWRWQATTGKGAQRRARPSSLLERLFSWPRTGKDESAVRLRADWNPHHSWLMLFHPDGYRRETALSGMIEAPTSAFRLAGLLACLNDHVPQVAAAAWAALGRLASSIPAEMVIASLPFYLAQRGDWQRLPDRGGPFEALLRRPDIRDNLFLHLQTRKQGDVARMFRRLLHDDLVDTALPRLASSARHPAVRARALKVLLAGEVDDVPGFRTEWISERLNVSRKVAVREKRPVRSTEPIAGLIRQGAGDSSILVCKAAADGLVRHWRQLDDVEGLIADFGAEPPRRVAERLDYVRRQHASNRTSRLQAASPER